MNTIDAPKQRIKAALLAGIRLTTAQGNRLASTVDFRKIISRLREEGLEIKDFWNIRKDREGRTVARYKTYYIDSPLPAKGTRIAGFGEPEINRTTVLTHNDSHSKGRSCQRPQNAIIMGLNEGTSATYIGIRDGKIALRVKEGTPGAVMVTSKESGKVSWIKYYRSISGYLTQIENRPDRFNERMYNWLLTIVDGEDTYILQIRESSGYARSLMKSLPNVDFSKKITFSPYVKIVDDKKRATLYLSQDNVNVEWYYTQEHPNGLPELRKHIDSRGNTTYDDSAILDFFVKQVEEVISPRIAQANRQRLGELPAEEPLSEEEDMADYMAREHERQVEAARAAQATPNAQPNELDPYHGARTRRAYTQPTARPTAAQPQTFSDGTPVPTEDDLPF